MFENFYDIIVVGGGHAGCEAAAAGAGLGKRVLLITMNMIINSQKYLLKIKVNKMFINKLSNQ